MTKNKIIISLISLIILIALVYIGIACYQNYQKKIGDIKDKEMENAQKITELKIEILKIGEKGKQISFGQTAVVHYTGWLLNGKKFDSSVDRGEPFKFVLDTGMVIPGWDLGIAGMEIGEKRKLTIPPDLAYKEQGIPGLIPSNAVLIFEVELLDIE